MKNYMFKVRFLFLSVVLWGMTLALSAQPATKTLFIYGGQANKPFVKYVANLTGKENPKICFLPTATGDRATYINFWYDLCHDLPVEPYVQKVWISSNSQTQTFEEVLMGMDAIIVGGGNTLNMLAIWQAQGIDQVLRKAYDKRIILAGGSAGSLCWFEGGTTDSRPVELGIVEGLAFLPYSHCPHYSSEASRRPLYFDNIKSGALNPGYACDDLSGIVFRDGKVEKAVSLDDKNHAYHVSLKEGEIVETRLESEIIK